ncbi:MAG TPA: hypothetical protein VI112_01735, partial [Bacteroidia bacterium]
MEAFGFALRFTTFFLATFLAGLRFAAARLAGFAFTGLFLAAGFFLAMGFFLGAGFLAAGFF